MEFLQILVTYLLGFAICVGLYFFGDLPILKRGPVGYIRHLLWGVGTLYMYNPSDLPAGLYCLRGPLLLWWSTHPEEGTGGIYTSSLMGGRYFVHYNPSDFFGDLPILKRGPVGYTPSLMGSRYFEHLWFKKKLTAVRNNAQYWTAYWFYILYISDAFDQLMTGYICCAGFHAGSTPGNNRCHIQPDTQSTVHKVCFISAQWWFVYPDTFVPGRYFQIKKFSGLLNRQLVQMWKSVLSLFVLTSEISGLSEPGLTNHHCVSIAWLHIFLNISLFKVLA